MRSTACGWATSTTGGSTELPRSWPPVPWMHHDTHLAASKIRCCNDLVCCDIRLTLPDDEARAALRKDDLAALADADELSIMRRTGASAMRQAPVWHEHRHAGLMLLCCPQIEAVRVTSTLIVKSITVGCRPRV
jgi:hypothetical protein